MANRDLCVLIYGESREQFALEQIRGYATRLYHDRIIREGWRVSVVDRHRVKERFQGDNYIEKKIEELINKTNDSLVRFIGCLPLTAENPKKINQEPFNNLCKTYGIKWEVYDRKSGKKVKLTKNKN